MKLSDVPLTEYSREEGLIAPDFEGLPLHLPRRCLMAFLGEKGVRIFFWTILVVLTLSLSFLCILLDSCRPR